MSDEQNLIAIMAAILYARVYETLITIGQAGEQPEERAVIVARMIVRVVKNDD